MNFLQYKIKIRAYKNKGFLNLPLYIQLLKLYLEYGRDSIHATKCKVEDVAQRIKYYL